jgi:hypothetical protein
MKCEATQSHYGSDAPVNRGLRDASVGHSSLRDVELARWEMHSKKTEVFLQAQRFHSISKRTEVLGLNSSVVWAVYRHPQLHPLMLRYSTRSLSCYHLRATYMFHLFLSWCQLNLELTKNPTIEWHKLLSQTRLALLKLSRVQSNLIMLKRWLPALPARGIVDYWPLLAASLRSELSSERQVQVLVRMPMDTEQAMDRYVPNWLSRP